MKTIEERAYNQYAGDNCPRDCEKCEMRTDCMDVDYVQAFIAGAQSEHEELTRWHDPKEYPKDNREVLAKCNPAHYIIALYNNELGVWVDAISGSSIHIRGWREIHEQ